MGANCFSMSAPGTKSQFFRSIIFSKSSKAKFQILPVADRFPVQSPILMFCLFRNMVLRHCLPQWCNLLHHWSRAFNNRKKQWIQKLKCSWNRISFINITTSNHIKAGAPLQRWSGKRTGQVLRSSAPSPTSPVSSSLDITKLWLLNFRAIDPCWSLQLLPLFHSRQFLFRHFRKTAVLHWFLGPRLIDPAAGREEGGVSSLFRG